MKKNNYYILILIVIFLVALFFNMQRSEVLFDYSDRYYELFEKSKNTFLSITEREELKIEQEKTDKLIREYFLKHDIPPFDTTYREE